MSDSKPTLAIVNTRVSTKEQLENNSINRQLESVRNAAQKLGAIIPEDGYFGGKDVSSKAGTNLNRKDLMAMLEYCKRHKNVKYAIFDEYDRFMRSVNEGAYFEVVFDSLGVKVWYASESETFNGDDAMAKFMRTMSGYRAEGSNEERITKAIHGHKKAIREGRYTFRSKPGYQKSPVPGVKLPHPVTFAPLQAAFKDMAAGTLTPLEALKRLNESDFNKFHATWRMDKLGHFAVDPYYAGQLVIGKKVQQSSDTSLHEPMITIEEHNLLVEIFSKRTRKRGHQKQYNPVFPLNKVLLCEDCELKAKFTGSTKNNGRNRKSTNYYQKYNCRGCGRSYHRTEVHMAVDNYLQEVDYGGEQESAFIEALETVWSQKNELKAKEAQMLMQHLTEINKKKSLLVMELASPNSEAVKSEIKSQIDVLHQQADETQTKINEATELDDDLAEFMQFALSYTEQLADDWWLLDHDDRVRCQELIFPGGLWLNSNKKVGTSELSPFYRLRPNKKDLSMPEKSLLVELPGTAPGSASLHDSHLQV